MSDQRFVDGDRRENIQKYNPSVELDETRVVVPLAVGVQELEITLMTGTRYNCASTHYDELLRGGRS